MPSYLITGANRGLGLGFVNELLENKDNVVVATARDTANASELQKLKSRDKDGRLFLINLDVSSQESIAAAAKEVSEILPSGLDNLISNAGVNYNGLKTFDELDVGELTAELDFTVTAPLLLVRGFLPLVRQGQAKRILVITSGLGSIERGAFLPNLANGYSIARAALNMLARKWSTVLKPEGITMALIHPGWVGITEIGSSISGWIEENNADIANLTTETSAADCMKVLNGLTIEDAGSFFNHDGTKIPW